ncbi:MAG: hypothetical protein IJI36_02975 [Kiritimatiellae bacterium]|nr:hypothetical protein [Kiritimatiellia bacterium]
MAYTQFFNIDPNYFPSVTQDLIKGKKVDWRAYCPHDTFVELLATAEKVLSRNAGYHLCIWVEGSYGTGKSHAVLTLKEMLDAPQSEVDDYFKKNSLPNDLLTKYTGLKKNKKILTVHRCISSDIRNDNDLFRIVQDSIRAELEAKGYEYLGAETLSGQIVKWLSDDANKAWIEAKLAGDAAGILEERKVADILDQLKKRTGEQLSDYVNRLVRVGDVCNVRIFNLDIDVLKGWIADVMEKNGIAIFFTWDEFTNYFENTPGGNFSGFQEICHLAETTDFTLLIVTHKGEEMFKGAKQKDAAKIFGRFVSPRCLIELPDDMAFKLMGNALAKNPATEKDWADVVKDFSQRLTESNRKVEREAGIKESVLQSVLPLHPYAALVLKYISESFQSNQRSMFDFIKNDRGDKIKAFQWFIQNVGPYDNWPFLTVDMLWDFFALNASDLKPAIRDILNSYRQIPGSLPIEDERVIKTLLLLAALSKDKSDLVSFLLPNDRNLSMAFEGTDLENNAFLPIVKRFVDEGILFVKGAPQNAGEMYATKSGSTQVDSKVLKELEAQARVENPFGRILDDDHANVQKVFGLKGALAVRYVREFSPVDHLRKKCNELRENDKLGAHIPVVFVFAPDDDAARKFQSTVSEIRKQGLGRTVIVNATGIPLGEDEHEKYVNHLALAKFYASNNGDLSAQEKKEAAQILNEWTARLAQGSFEVYSEAAGVVTCPSVEEVFTALRKVVSAIYTDCVEDQYRVTDGMYEATMLQLGAECGLCQETKSMFRSSNPSTKLEAALNGAWKIDKYWDANPTLFISRLKAKVDTAAQKAFGESGKISIRDVYEIFREGTYGFLPCNLTAFLLGFLLKEYATEEYTWDNGGPTEPMSAGKMKQAIANLLKDELAGHSAKYKDEWIVAMSAEQKEFRRVVATVFKQPENLCTSLSNARDRIRARMIELTFPIWALKDILEDFQLTTKRDILEGVIDDLTGVANAQNIDKNKTETDFALRVGRKSLDNPSVMADLVMLVTPENTRKGMQAYLSKYNGGRLLQLSEKIGDHGKYLDALKEHCSAGAANWVWNAETLNAQIDALIVEYSIVAKSNELINKTSDFAECCRQWSDRLEMIRVSYEAAKAHLAESFKPLAAKLYLLKKSGAIPESERKDFLAALESEADGYTEFYNNQYECFCKIGDFYLQDLSDDDRKAVFARIKEPCFVKPQSEYIQLIEKERDAYLESKLVNRLKSLWADKTGTASPIEWSEKYRTPVLALVPEKEFAEASRAFAIINAGSGKDIDVKLALKYLDKIGYWDALNDERRRDEAFVRYLVKDYASILPDLAKVREHLKKRVLGISVYDWGGAPEVSRQIEAYANAEYVKSGKDKVVSKIEGMSADEVKIYLKNLVESDIKVGLAILGK